MTKNLVYLSYGQGPHVQEIIFSILSARYFLCGEPGVRIVVYTDDPAPFADLNVTIELLTPAILENWLGPHGYAHRRKILAMGHALENHGSSLLLDSDTYFTRSPEQIFARINSNRSVMHLCEGPLKHLREHRLLVAALCEAPFEVHGVTYDFWPNWGMWNSGVIGMDASQAPLIEKIVALNDQIQERQANNVSEQVAFARTLQTTTRMAGAEDVVFHYWRAYLRQPFSEQMNNFLPQAASMPLGLRAVSVYPHRPRPDWKRHLRSSAKSLLHNVGITHVGLRSNG